MSRRVDCFVVQGIEGFENQATTFGVGLKVVTLPTRVDEIAFGV